MHQANENQSRNTQANIIQIQQHSSNPNHHRSNQPTAWNLMPLNNLRLRKSIKVVVSISNSLGRIGGKVHEVFLFFLKKLIEIFFNKKIVLLAFY